MMNPSVHVFEPDLQVQFSGRLWQASRSMPKSSRELFYHLVHSSEYDVVLIFAYQFIQQHLLNLGKQSEAGLLPGSIQNLMSQQHEGKGELFQSQLSTNQAVTSLIQSVPSILTSPCWLQFMPQTCSGDAKFALRIQQMYMQLQQNPTREIKLKNQFLAFLMAAGRELPAIHTHAFSKQDEHSDASFELAAMQLALAQFPRVFFPEILGFTLAYCQSVTVIESIATDIKMPAQENAGNFYLAQQQLLSEQIPKIKDIINDYLLQFNSQSAALMQRIYMGHCLYRKLYLNCRKRQFPVLSIEQRLLCILRDKAAAALGHHHRIMLEGKPLDAWFEQQPFAGDDFLQALKRSFYVNTASPEDSQLLKLFAFNGPMFGVLSDEELQILKSWLDSIENGKTIDKKNHTKQSGKHSNTQMDMDIEPKTATPCQSSINFAKLNNRELYFYLVNGDLYPEVWHTAKIKVRKLLRSIKYQQHLPFRKYQHQVFEEYIEHCYQQEIKAFQPLVDKPRLSKQAYVWGIEQFAPTILTDGCWLQGCTQLQLFPNHALADILYKIYSDEIGNGLQEQNHPHIYRQLLNSLSIELPAIYDPSFIQHQGFIRSAFDLPVYLMAISRFPSHFLPELLGLNLAIELSGLGAVYLRLSEELKYWGINSHIVDLHMTIDNVASGHTALAIRAIKLHLDDVKSCLGEQEMQQQWQRIYIGYCSLQTVSKWFKYALIIQYQLRRWQNIFATQIAV